MHRSDVNAKWRKKLPAVAMNQKMQTLMLNNQDPSNIPRLITRRIEVTQTCITMTT